MVYKPPEIPEEAKKIAEKFFEHAETVADTRNYDYAIELYLQGLHKNTAAVEQGHKALREVAMHRKSLGGKRPGLVETFKRSTTHKDPLTAMLNAEYLLAKDPFNLAYIEALAKNADRAELPDALLWILPFYLEASRQEKKIHIDRLLNIRNYYEKLGEYYESQNQADLGVECLQRAVAALELAMQEAPRGMDLSVDHRDLVSKFTIMRGKYGTAEDFRDSVQDAESQKMLQDSKKAVKSEEVLEHMIRQAQEELQADPTVAGKVNKLVDLLLQRGMVEDEQQAMVLLDKSHQQTGQYSFKMRADDIRLRQMQRKIRQARAQLENNPQDQDAKTQLAELQKQLIAFELDIYKERTAQYPTDLHLKFEYAVRLFHARQYDQAIPLFQEASAEPRHGIRAKFYIGSCFFNKGWHDQAVDTLKEAIEAYPLKGDNLFKEMHYVLARTYEQASQTDSALDTYSQIVKLDYNYRDVRHRIESMQKKPKNA